MLKMEKQICGALILSRLRKKRNWENVLTLSWDLSLYELILGTESLFHVQVVIRFEYDFHVACMRLQKNKKYLIYYLCLIFLTEIRLKI